VGRSGPPEAGDASLKLIFGPLAAIVALDGPLDVRVARRLLDYVTVALAMGWTPLVLDVRNLSRVDAFGRAALCRIRRKAAAAGCDVIVVGCDSRADDVAGFLGRPRIVPDRRAALAAVAAGQGN
jgi:ABC-type transporter Mla MlaB component